MWAIDLNKDGTATTNVKYTLGNPFNKWKEGRDPEMVTALMLTRRLRQLHPRLCPDPGAVLTGVAINDKPAGAEQANEEMGKKAFGQSFNVLPGSHSSIKFSYNTPLVIETAATAPLRASTSRKRPAQTRSR